MKDNDIEDIRQWCYDELELCKDGSFPKEERILSLVLIMTTEALNK